MDSVLLLLCALALFAVVIAAIVWLFRLGRAPHAPYAYGSPPDHSEPPPAEPAPGSKPGLGHFAALDQLVAGWAAAGRLEPELAERVRDLIAEEWAATAGQAASPSVAGAVKAPASQVATEPAVATGVPHAPQPEVAPTVASVAVAQPAPAVAAMAPAAAPFAPQPPVAPPAAPQPPVAPPAAPRASRRSLGAALLSLGTRRTLLFLGTFLLLMSSLTLVIFNWASLHPAAQLAILAGTTATIWAGGAWMARKPDLATAGRNLQAVAALLMPVVGFALGRPGLLDLAPRPSWQLASAISLGAYLVAATRTRRPFYSGAASLAAASLLFASLGNLAIAWQLVPVLALMAAMLPLAGALGGSSAPRLADGPRWVGLIGGPVLLLGSTLLYLADGSGDAFAAALAVGTVFCLLAHRLSGRLAWLWAAVALPPAALQVALLEAEATMAIHALGLALMALGYFALCAALEGRALPALRPLFAGSLGLALLAVPLIAVDGPASRLALPPLIIMGAAATALVEAGRLGWLGARRAGLATAGLTAAALLLFAWLGALVALWGQPESVGGLAVLPLAAIYFAGARWWPGRLRASYDQSLQVVAVLVTLVAGGLALSDGETRLAGALALAAIFGGQALARRLWPWAASCLVAIALAVGAAIERFAPQGEELRIATLAALALAALYSLGGERVRRGGLRSWTWPGVGLGAAAGAATAGLALLQYDQAPGLAAGALVALAALAGAHTALWRRDTLGYLAAPLLIAATMVAAREGFFTGWRPAPGDLAYVVCALALGLALLGWGLRRFGRAYGRPYELAAFAILPVAPLMAAGDRAHLALTWGAMTLLYAAALWRYRLPWMLALVFVALDMALLNGSAWLVPGGAPANAGVLLAAAVGAQALFSAWARRRASVLGGAGQWGYLSATLGGLGALALAASGPWQAALAAGLLAATLAVLVWIEGREELAWGALGLLALALSQLHRQLELSLAWSLLAASFEALAIYGAGWGLAAMARRLPRLAPWRRPMALAAGGATIALPLALALVGMAEPAGMLGSALLLAGLGVALLGWRGSWQALAGPAVGLWILAVVAEGPALSPAGWARFGAYLLLGLAWVCAGGALGRRLMGLPRRAVAAAGPLHLALYGATTLAGLLALSQARDERGPLALVCLGLAALLALVATAERREAAAWGSLGLALGGAWLWHGELGLAPAWATSWLVLELVGVSLAGWALALAGQGLWRRPTTLGAVAAGAILTASVAGLTLGVALPPLTFALASLGLLLATVAVRERELYYAYGAGAAFVGAALCQLADWGFKEPQWYVAPAGLYLLALAWGLRRFQGRRRASQLVETAAVALLLGVTFGQALRGEPVYSLVLFCEALLVAGYGALARLRVPFVGGVGFFVAGVLWMTVDAVLPTNQWVLLGSAGLLMVLAYVVLERHQERLVRAGRRWMGQLASWG